MDDAFKDLAKERLLDRSFRDEETGCLRWTGPHNHAGYGDISVKGKAFSVHRLSYQVWIGPIPTGLDLDHVHAWGCRHRDCFEPSHLEPVTKAENTRRRVNLPAPVTHCPHGHEYTEENAIWKTNRQGYEYRECRTCKRARHGSKRTCEECGEQVTASNLGKHRAAFHSPDGHGGQVKCNICGKFRSRKDIVESDHGDEAIEMVIECRGCMSPVDRERYGMELAR